MGDAKLGPAMTGYGELSVPIRALIDGKIEWPSKASADLEALIGEGVGRSSEFMVDREDLCLLLASDSDVARGRLYAWLPTASFRRDWSKP